MTIEYTFLAISIRLKFETMTARVLIDIKLYTRLKNTAGSHPWCVLNESKLHKCSSIVLVFWAWGENLVYIWWKAKKNKMVKQTRKRNTENTNKSHQYSLVIVSYLTLPMEFRRVFLYCIEQQCICRLIVCKGNTFCRAVACLMRPIWLFFLYIKRVSRNASILCCLCQNVFGIDK